MRFGDSLQRFHVICGLVREFGVLMRFLIRRLVLFVVTLLGLSLAIFAALRILPGDVAGIMAGFNAPQARVARLRSEMGLNKPLSQQYLDWIAGMFKGDYGTSMLTGRSVASMVGERASITLPLITLGLLIALTVGLTLGVVASLSKKKGARAFFRVVGIVGGSIPALWGGSLLILLFSRGAGLIGFLPSQGFPLDGWHSAGTAFASLVLPSLTVGLIDGSSLMRYTRSALEDVMNDDYMLEAMACGYTRAQAMLHVGLRVIVPQLVSVAGLMFASMVTGVMVIENLFALPGIGSGLVVDLGNRDLIAVQSELFLLAAFFLVVGFVVDVSHRVLDPRLRRSSEGRE
jgi:peptide/nickel transport system permease protein